MHYPFTLTPDDNGTLLITCDLLPEVTSFAETEEDAHGNAMGAILTAFMGRIADREAIPLPEGEVAMPFVNLSALEVLKIGLHNAMVEDGMRKADLARAMEVHQPQVDRLLDLFYKSKIDQLQEAIAATGRTIEVRVRAA